MNATSECCVNSNGTQNLVDFGKCQSEFAYCGWEMYDKSEDQCCRSIQGWTFKERTGISCDGVPGESSFFAYVAGHFSL